MSSAQQQEYFRRLADEQKRKQIAVARRRKRETPEEAAQRWRHWARYALFATAALAILYTSWAYLWPLISPRVLKPKPMEQLTIEEVVAEFKEDAVEAEKKYAKKRIVVEGKLMVEPVVKKGPATARAGRIYFELAGEKGEDAKVYCEFFDIDDAESAEPGDAVKVSGVIQQTGPGRIKLVGASLLQ